MRVIETFVTFVPREKIPADAKWFVQGSVSGGLFSITGKDKPVLCGTGWHGIGKTLRHSTQPVATDATETVVTREELMRAYDLVEQGYTLWFGGECPVECGAIVDVVFRNKKRDEASDVGEYYRWSSRGVDTDIIAYRLSRSVDKDVAAVNRVTNARDSASLVELDHADTIIAAAIEKRIELMNDEKWDTGYDKVCINSETGYLASKGSNLVIITRAQWDDYVSRKIRAGDRVFAGKDKTVHEVLFVGETTSFTRNEHGFEGAILTSMLTRISQ